jgi:hypothetical protein
MKDMHDLDAAAHLPVINQVLSGGKASDIRSGFGCGASCSGIFRKHPEAARDRIDHLVGNITVVRSAQ